MHRIHTISFKHAWEGLVYAFSTQPNFVIHLSASLLVVVTGLLFGLTLGEWVVLVLTIAMGLVIELINTAIESVVDLMTDQYHISAKRAKDTAAAAMLVYSWGSIIVGLLIFLPKIWPYISVS